MTTVAPAYGQPQYDQGGMQQQTVVMAPPQTMVIVQESKPENHVCISIFTCLCCFWPIGLAALIFACMVDSRWDGGDKEGAKSASKTAGILWKWALGLGIAGIIIAIIIVPIYLFVIVPAQIASAINAFSG